jgi:hypothetical protein
LAGPAVSTLARAALVLDEADLRSVTIAGHGALGQVAALVSAYDHATGARQTTNQ